MILGMLGSFLVVVYVPYLHILGLFRPKQLGYIGILVMHFYIKKRKVEKTKKQVQAGFVAMIFRSCRMCSTTVLQLQTKIFELHLK